MNPTLKKLLSDMFTEIDVLMDGLAGGQLSSVAWHNEMVYLFGAYHTAAYLVGAETDTLTHADEARVLRAVETQVEYLDGFTDAIEAAGGDFNETWRARAMLYGGAIKGLYWEGVTGDADLPAYPGDGSTPCYGSCGCAWHEHNGAWYWERGKTDSCGECVRREREWAPYHD